MRDHIFSRASSLGEGVLVYGFFLISVLNTAVDHFETDEWVNAMRCECEPFSSNVYCPVSELALPRPLPCHISPIPSIPFQPSSSMSYHLPINLLPTSPPRNRKKAHPNQNPQKKRRAQTILLFPNSLPNPPESIRANRTDHNQISSGTEAASGQVTAVLDGLVAAGWGHVLRHCGRVV